MGGERVSGENLETLIRAIRVKNFKTLRDVTLPFAEGITVFVGANNSGKTNALQLLKLIARAVYLRVPQALHELGGVKELLTRGSTGDFEYEIDAELDQFAVSYGVRYGKRSMDHREWLRGHDFKLEANGAGEMPQLDGLGPFRGEVGVALQSYGDSEKARPEIHALFEAIAEIGVYDLSPEAMRQPAVVKQAPILGPDGAELAAVLDALPPQVREAIDQEVSKAANVRKVLTLPTPKSGEKVVGIYEATGETFGAEQISDGLLLFIGLSTALQMRRTRKTIIAIEEPERGIHPRRLEQLVNQFWRLTEGGTQVVLTTHSPLVLDQFRDHPESVMIFDRQGADTRVTRLVDQPAWQDALELNVRALGDIWYSGVLGGVPPP
ncbi:MAG TPA: AAA family ATPase [Myxococcales bacterium]|nr:AAA family ATPase [Myxococcales bacterium]